jgi:magnesium chelatase subunit I
VQIPSYVKEVVEEVAFQARAERKIDKRSGVSQRMSITCLENALSNAERRALVSNENPVVPRVTDVYAAIPSLTGKFELEYEGELRGADNIARDLIRSAVGAIFTERLNHVETQRVIEWFDMGGTLQIADTSSATELIKQARSVQGLVELAEHLDVNVDAPAPILASAVDFVLEGLYAQKKISRSEQRGYQAVEQPPRRATRQADTPTFEEGLPLPSTGKKKYYN